jgi:hypothetical protein
VFASAARRIRKSMAMLTEVRKVISGINNVRNKELQPSSKFDEGLGSFKLLDLDNVGRETVMRRLNVISQ